MSNTLSGRQFLVGFTLVMGLVAIGGFFVLRQASSRRFAVSIHMVPESPLPDVVTLGRPIKVRIDKRSAGRSPLPAVAMLLDGNGRLLADLRPLAVRELPRGKRAEDVEFPPLTEVPGQRLTATIVLRLPPEQLPAARAYIAAVLRDTEANPGQGGQLPKVFERILLRCRELGGHAELAQIEVREKL
jgi:hypothetical protein